MLQEVQTFLYREARLLELNRFDEWLELFTDDVRYWMPVREEVQGQEGTGGGADSFSLYDDDKKSLSLRVTRIQTGGAHAEVPASVTQRLITNILAQSSGDDLEVSSSFMVYQERRGRHGVTFFGRRDDLLRRHGESFRIARRKIELAQAILPSTISIFF
jgi:3-phenylpropionate/cinnamic acid dioxygenase small subunit